MENVSQEISICPASGWNDAAAAFLVKAMASDPLAGVEALKISVENGEAQLFHVLFNNYLVAAFVLRVDQKPHGAEGVIVAAGGRLNGVSLLRLTLADIERRFIGCTSIRVHTARRGIMREFSRFGYAPREIILSKVI